MYKRPIIFKIISGGLLDEKSQKESSRVQKESNNINKMLLLIAIVSVILNIIQLM